MEPTHVPRQIANTHPTVPVVPEDLGPAMLALNPRQRAFVVAMFLGMSQYDAAVAAGYEGTRQSLDTTAWRLAHNEKVQAALREEANKRVVTSLPAMVANLAKIANNDDHRQQLDAVKHSLAIAGVSPKIQHEVVHKSDRASLVQEIAGMIDLLKALGVPIDLKTVAEPVTIDVTPNEN